MYSIDFGKSGIKVPTIAVGCMRIEDLSEKELSAFIDKALSLGANFFDHADIYDSEEVFGKALTPSIRDKMFIQTKCGIRDGRYDFSYDHIVTSVENSLRYLKTDHIDALLLHRPDTLMEPEEVARAFSDLKAAGKVLHFGVSNQSSYQMALLQSALDVPLCANQLQFGIVHTPMINSGNNVNMTNEFGINRDGGVLEYCRLNKITIQPWSPLQFGFIYGCFLDHEGYPELNATLDKIAEKYSVSKTAIAFAWILRHPAKMQPITGTTNIKRLEDCIKATDIRITHEEWYEIYRAAGNELP
ncbi:MAG: aldo/keto reductase [Clostridia bacterium]|nr:aldo/keto reductase [Clostridia bacterium]